MSKVIGIAASIKAADEARKLIEAENEKRSKADAAAHIEMVKEDKRFKPEHNMDIPSYQGYYQNFDRLYSIYPDLEMPTLRQYVFIVRPDLNLLDEGNPNVVSKTCSQDRYTTYMARGHNIVCRQLTDKLSSEHDFMTFPCGRIESLQVPDLSIKTSTISQPYTNLLMPYGGNAWESKTGGTFDITFREEAQMRIHKIFQLWVYYIDCVTRNVFQPKRKYVDYNKFDYMSSVYYIVCGPDGESILWWSKYTGCFPTSAPNSDMSFNLRGGEERRTTIPFVYYYNESMNPDILADFNRNAKLDLIESPGAIPCIKNYDESTNGSGSGISGTPFIASPDRGMSFQLKWKPAKVF